MWTHGLYGEAPGESANNNNNKAKLIDTENRLVVAKNVGLGVSTWVLGYAILSRSVVSDSCLLHGL